MNLKYFIWLIYGIIKFILKLIYLKKLYEKDKKIYRFEKSNEKTLLKQLTVLEVNFLPTIDYDNFLVFSRIKYVEKLNSNKSSYLTYFEVRYENQRKFILTTNLFLLFLGSHD